LAWDKIGESGVVLTPMNSFLLLGVLLFCICANYGENQLRNATMRVHTDGWTDKADRPTNAQMQISFIICPMPYAICHNYGADNLYLTAESHLLQNIML